MLARAADAVRMCAQNIYIYMLPAHLTCKHAYLICSNACMSPCCVYRTSVCVYDGEVESLDLSDMRHFDVICGGTGSVQGLA